MQRSGAIGRSFKEECRRKGKLCEWTFERLQEACDKVAMEDIGRSSVALEIFFKKNTDFLTRIIAPMLGMGGVTLSSVCPHCSCFPLDDFVWWVSTGHGDGHTRKKKHCSWWCAACGGQYEQRPLNRILVVQIGANADRAKVFKAHAAPMGLCDNLVNALKLLANQQKDGESPTQNIITGLHERSRRGIMDGLRRFIEADNHSAVDVGGLRRGTISVNVKKPQFSEAFPEAVIRDGADELRADEVGTQRASINTKHTEFERWRWMRTGTLSVKQSTKELKGKNGKSCAIITKN